MLGAVPPRTRKHRSFNDPRLVELAAAIEREHAGRFVRFGADLTVGPRKFAHLTTVGAGVCLDVDPHDIGGWEHWGYFESDVEVRVRRRFSRRWRDVMSVDEIRAWLEREVADYLRTLEERTVELEKRHAH
jgi:hypothetical protein